MDRHLIVMEGVYISKIIGVYDSLDEAKEGFWLLYSANKSHRDFDGYHEYRVFKMVSGHCVLPDVEWDATYLPYGSNQNEV